MCDRSRSEVKLSLRFKEDIVKVKAVSHAVSGDVGMVTGSLWNTPKHSVRYSLVDRCRSNLVTFLRLRYDRRVVRGNTYAAIVQPEDETEVPSFVLCDIRRVQEATASITRNIDLNKNLDRWLKWVRSSQNKKNHPNSSNFILCFLFKFWKAQKQRDAQRRRLRTKLRIVFQHLVSTVWKRALLTFPSFHVVETIRSVTEFSTAKMQSCLGANETKKRPGTPEAVPGACLSFMWSLLTFHKHINFNIIQEYSRYVKRIQTLYSSIYISYCE